MKIKWPVPFLASGQNVAPFKDRIRQAVKQLNEFPERGRVIPELKKQGIPSYRELIVSPRRIMYRVSDGQIFVLSVIDGRMNVEDVLLNRFL